MLHFEHTPQSFMRAALLHLREGWDIAPQDTSDLFAGYGSSANDPDIIQRYQALRANERWGDELVNTHVLKLIYFNLRHGVAHWPLLVQGVAELLRRGPGHLLCGSGDAAHRLVSRRKAVLQEIHRLTGFTRLSPAADGTMVGRAPTKHHTGDLLALGLARRNPASPLALITPTGAWYAWKGRVSPLEQGGLDLADDDFGQVWMTYYRSQFIRERNNPRHAARAIPQEYWQWLDEGKELHKYRSQKQEVRGLNASPSMTAGDNP